MTVTIELNLRETSINGEQSNNSLGPCSCLKCEFFITTEVNNQYVPRVECLPDKKVVLFSERTIHLDGRYLIIA